MSVPSRPRFRPAVEALEGRCVPALIPYNGGPLLTHVEVQALYYGPRWSAPAYQSQVTYLEGFLNTVVQDSYLDTLTKAGYGVGRGSASPGKLLSGGLGHTHAVTDRQIQQALRGAIQKGRLQAPDDNRLYVVYIQPRTGVRPIEHGGETVGIFGYYHSTFRDKARGGHRTAIYYAVVPYPGANGNLPGLSTRDTLTTLTSRAVADAVTDPGRTPNTVGSGWTSGEGADIGRLAGNEYVYLDGYAVQRVVNQNQDILTPAGAAAFPPVSFVLQGNGDLIEQTPSGPQKRLSSVMVVSPASIDAHGRAMVDAILTDGEAFEVHDGGAAVLLAGGVKEAQAGQSASYVLLQDGMLKEFAPLLGNSEAMNDAKSPVTAFTVGLDLSGANLVQAVLADGTTRAFSDPLPIYGG